MEPTQRRLLPSTATLSAFDAVARLGSMSAAAAALNLTPGAISRHVALLEEQLGVALINRTNRGVELTDKGRRYAEGADALLRSLRLLSLEAMSDNASAVFGLAILPTFGTRWLMPRMPDFLARNPAVIIDFATRIGQFDFEGSGIDAAIHIGEPNWPGTDCQFLMHELVAPVCSPAFLAENPVGKPEDLLSKPLFDMASRPRAWEQWFASLGMQEGHGGGMRFEQFSNVVQACLAGLGIALVPTFLIEPELASGQLVRAFDHEVKSASAYYLVRPLSRMAYGPASAFSAWIIDQARDFSSSTRAGSRS
jgi:LysR family transcriptional regulator, glycine cleavage system transcriptional activator